MTGRITVAKLIERGLTDQPAYVSGVGLPTATAVLCRRHVNDSTLRLAGVQPADEAVLLVGGADTEHALSSWCS